MTVGLGTGGHILNFWSDVNVNNNTFDGTSQVADVGGFVGDMKTPGTRIENSHSIGNGTAQPAAQNLCVGEFLGRQKSNCLNAVGPVSGGVRRDSTGAFGSVGTVLATGITAATEVQMENRAFFKGRGWAIVPASANDSSSGTSAEVAGIDHAGPWSSFLSWQASAKVQSCVVAAASGELSTVSAKGARGDEASSTLGSSHRAESLKPGLGALVRNAKMGHQVCSEAEQA